MSENVFSKKYVLFSVCMALLFLVSCATRTPPSSQPPGQRPYKVMGKWYYPIPDATGYRQKGLASWYGPGFHGKTTANGEKYNMHAMTAAHKTLPFGTLVRVRNLENNREVVVRINDRGPFVRGRIIDLSNASAQAIGLDVRGVGPVEIKAVASDRKNALDMGQGDFSVQVGAFTQRMNADRLAEKLKQEGHRVHVFAHDRGDAVFFRVRVKGYGRLEAAERAEADFRKKGYGDAMVVAE